MFTYSTCCPFRSVFVCPSFKPKFLFRVIHPGHVSYPYILVTPSANASAPPMSCDTNNRATMASVRATPLILRECRLVDNLVSNIRTCLFIMLQNPAIYRPPCTPLAGHSSGAARQKIRSHQWLWSPMMCVCFRFCSYFGASAVP